MSVQTHLLVRWHLGYPAMQVMGLIRILNAVCLLVSPQQFYRASWSLQASVKLLQYDITHLATPATHAWADAGAGAQGTAAEAAGSPVHATESARESDTSHKRQRAHHPSLCHPGADGSPQGMWMLPLCLDWVCLFSTPYVSYSLDCVSACLGIRVLFINIMSSGSYEALSFKRTIWTNCKCYSNLGMAEMVSDFMTNPKWDLVFAIMKSISLPCFRKWFQV